MKKLHTAILLASLLLGASTIAQVNESTCGPLENAFGPFDYRPDRDRNPGGSGSHHGNLKLVEGAHFTRDVEMLIRGNHNIKYPGGDLDYTLRAFPNHHRALQAVMLYGEKFKTENPPNLRRSVECYFERAVRFRSDDPIVRMLYATYLNKHNRPNEAVNHLQRAATIGADDPFTQYNIGLVYYDMKMYDRALVRAHRAMELQFPGTKLRELLTQAGHWKEPPNAPKTTP